MENNWYVAVNGETYGPYTWTQMYEMTKTQNIVPQSLIYHEQIGSWVEAYTIKELGLSMPLLTNQQHYVGNPTNQQPNGQYNPSGMVPKKKKGCLIGCLSVFIVTLIGLGLIIGLVIWPMFNKPMLNLEKAIEVASEKIDEEGGIVEVEDSNSKIDGLTIEVPEGAYDTKKTFKISTQEIKEHEFGEYFKPILPLIHVENGGDMSEQIMTVTIPIDLDPDEIPLACYYTEDGRLEPIETVGLTSNEMTIGVSHFSDIIVTALQKSLLEEYVGKAEHNSGFMPGVDSWSFTNYGSQISDGGMCAGMTITAIHYYLHETLDGGQPLHYYLDNNHYNATPDWWKDDSLGIRLSSVVQEEANWTKYTDWTYNQMHKAEFLSDEIKFYQFAYAFLLTDAAPQGVSLWVRSVNNGTVELSAGHAIIAYAMDETGIYVADPNFPDRTDLKIPFDGTKFGIYNTMTKAGEQVYPYNSFSMLGTTSLYSKESMDDLFEEATKDPYESTVGDHLFSNPVVRYMILEDGETLWVENVAVVEISPEDGSRYKKKVNDFITDSGLTHVENTKPADWDTEDYLFAFVDVDTNNGVVEVYINKEESRVIGKRIHSSGEYLFIPISSGVNNVGMNFAEENSHTEGNESWKSYEAIDFYRTSVFFGEIDLTGVWKGDFQIVEYEKALNFLEEMVVMLLRGFVRSLAVMFEQDLTDAEIDQIVRDSIEVNEQLTDPIPMEVVLSNRNGDTYDADITYETDAYYVYETKAVFDGDTFEFTVVSEDGAQMDFSYYVYDNETMSGEFEMIYAMIKDFITGVSNLQKQ